MDMNTVSSVTVDPEALRLEITVVNDGLEEPSQSETDTDPDSSLPMLLKLPDVVLQKVLSYLEPIHIFSLRLTSKAVNFLATESMNRISKSKLQIKFNMEIVQSNDKSQGGSTTTTFRDILDNGYIFPIRSLCLDNTNEDIFKDPCITKFLQLYGSGIKKLKIKNFCLTSRAQLQFFMQLKNLLELKILNIEIPEEAETEYLLELSIPKTFNNIEILKVGKIQYPCYTPTAEDFPEAFLDKFPNLEILRIPKVCYKAYCSFPEESLSNDWEIDYLINYFRKQVQKNDSTLPKLVKIDLKNIEDIDEVEISSHAFVNFANDLFRKFPLIQFHNVSEKFLHWFDLLTIIGQDEEDIDTFKAALNNHIRSMKNISQSVMDLELGNLTKLDVNISECLKGYGRSSIPIKGFWQGMNTDLSELIKLRIYYDKPDWSEDELENMDFDGQYDDMQAFLLHSPRYESLKELRVEFGEAYGNLKIASSRFDGHCLINHFCMIKKLELINWNPRNKVFVHLWEGFGDNGMLEELILKDCASLGNVAFIGTDEENPVFLKLKGLRKLTLKVDKMDKLSDRTFKDVFRHMSLMEFTLISQNPMHKITRKGIEWLLEGSFAKSILKFPFTTWTATTIQPEEMLPLKAQFKSLIY